MATDWLEACMVAERQRDDVAAERDRYRQALEDIRAMSRSSSVHETVMARIAERALGK